MTKTDLQQKMQRQSCSDTLASDRWFAEQGIDPRVLVNTHIILLQAQRQAHQLLTYDNHLLNISQKHILSKFLKLMAHNKLRVLLKPEAAHAVLNINTKINRQKFKQHRQLNKAKA
jgi:hypothetical protein